MRVIRAQFAPRRDPSVWLWGLLALCLIVTACLQWQTREIGAQHEAQRQQAQQVARDAAEQAERAARAPLPYAESLAEIMKLRSVQWPQLLAVLEVTPRSELQLLSVEIDVAQRRGNISVSAPSMRAVLDYAQALRSGTHDGELAWRFSVGRVTERAGGGSVAELAGSWGRH